MSGVRVGAVMYKQMQDTLKNKSVLIQFLLFPMIALVATKTAGELNFTQNYFINMFSVMYVTMAPIVVMSTTVSEDKEKGSLRMLRMANVKPLEYIIGVSAYSFILCLMGLLFMVLIGDFSFASARLFFLLNVICLVTSILIGSIIGLVSPNRNASTGLAVPIMMFFSLLPMFSTFNSTIKNVSQFLYSQQIHDGIMSVTVSRESIFILMGNLVVILLIYIITYRKSRF